MHIRSVQTKNYKNLSLNHSPLGRTTLVMGRNGQGKTNLLRLLEMAFRSKSADTGKDQRFKLEGNIPDTGLVRFGEKKASVSIKVESDTEGHAKVAKALEKYGAMNDKVGRIDFDIEENKSGSRWVVTLLKIGNAELVGPHKIELKGEEQDLVLNYINDEWCDSVVYVPLNRFPTDHKPSLQVGARVDPARDLPNALHALINGAGENEATIDSVKEVMDRFFGISDIRVAISRTESTEPSNGPTSFVSIKLKEANGKWIPLADMGAGVQQLLVVSVMVHRSKGASVVLIEEFETSMSLQVRPQLWEEFRKLVGDAAVKQVIASSHTFFKAEEGEQLTLGPVPLDEMRQVDFQKWQDHHWQEHQGLAVGTDAESPASTKRSAKAPTKNPTQSAARPRGTKAR